MHLASTGLLEALGDMLLRPVGVLLRQLARAGLGGVVGTAAGQAELGMAIRAAARLAGCCCLSARLTCSRSSRCCVAASWLVLASAKLGGFSKSLLCRRSVCCCGAPPLPPVLWSYPGFTCRAIGGAGRIVPHMADAGRDCVEARVAGGRISAGCPGQVCLIARVPECPPRFLAICSARHQLPCRLDESGPY